MNPKAEAGRVSILIYALIAIGLMVYLTVASAILIAGNRKWDNYLAAIFWPVGVAMQIALNVYDWLKGKLR